MNLVWRLTQFFLAVIGLGAIVAPVVSFYLDRVQRLLDQINSEEVSKIPTTVNAAEGKKSALEIIFHALTDFSYDNPIFGAASYVYIPAFWILVASALVAAGYGFYKLFRLFERTENGISILQLEMNIDILNEHHSRVSRVQYFNVDRAGVDAYRASMTAQARDAKILPQSLVASTSLNRETLTKELIYNSDVHFNDVRHMEYIETFIRELPSSLIARILPNLLVLFFFERGFFFTKRVFERRVTVDYCDEHFNIFNTQAFDSASFPASNIKINLRVPLHLAPKIRKVSSVQYKSNAAKVRTIVANADAYGAVVYSAFAKHLNNEVLQLRWELFEGAEWNNRQAELYNSSCNSAQISPDHQTALKT